MVNIREIDVKQIITKSKLPDADYVINPYIGCTHGCMYCYAEFMKRFSKHDEIWGSFLDIKRYSKLNGLKSIKNDSGKTILIGSVTDPYNPYEEKYRVTRKVLEDLAKLDVSLRIEILTKSKLVLRDLDLLKKFKNIHVGISLNSINDNFRKIIEPRASSVEERIETIDILRKSNISTYLFISPIFPGLTEFEKIIDEFGPKANYICFENLNLRGNYKKKILKFIDIKREDLKDLYNDIYNKKNNEYWEKIKKIIERKCRENNLNYRIYFYHDQIKKK